MDLILKGQLVNVAIKQLSLSGALLQSSGRDQEDFLQYLEMMMSSWTNKGLQLGYKLSEFGVDPDATEDSGIAIDEASGVALNLACYAASAKGMIPPPRLSAEAYKAYNGLFSAELIQRDSNSMLPNGAGNNPYGWWGGNFQPIEDDIDVENDGKITL